MRWSGPLIVVSPHLDDGVMSCGQLLSARPGSVVVTVFAGRPSDGRRGPWDERCFGHGDDPLTVRWAEDRRAVQQVGSTPLHMGFLEDQYAPPPTVNDISRALAHATSGIDAGTWVLPLGTKHPDHLLAHRAAVELLGSHGQIDWIVYEELPYRRQYPSEVQARLQQVQRDGLELVAVRPPAANRIAKARAVWDYRSQARAIGKDMLLTLCQERYWRASVRTP
jgi:LmbE family N-acetylglucosaminyl deacetylase